MSSWVFLCFWAAQVEVSKLDTFSPKLNATVLVGSLNSLASSKQSFTDHYDTDSLATETFFFYKISMITKHPGHLKCCVDR